MHLATPHTNWILTEANRRLDNNETYRAMAPAQNPYGDGTADARTADERPRWLARAIKPPQSTSPRRR
ncbi:MAG: UDP-N-acetylglucosamine 2-epimerase [Neolewinella sp.]|jgi:UDP-N-acetylglucosamine 2-epimerase